MTAIGNYYVLENECWGAKNMKFEITRYVAQNTTRNKSNDKLHMFGSDTALLDLLKNYTKLELEPIQPVSIKHREEHLFKNRPQEQEKNGLHLDLSSKSISQKSVRFADKFGLKLSNVKTFTPSPDSTITPSPQVTPIPTLVPMFAQPRCSPNFLTLVHQKNISLESASMSGNNSVSGLIWVTNIQFQKNVAVRWTKDNWNKICEDEAEYVEDDNTEVDKFSFTVEVGDISIGGRVELCFRYESGGGQYWDNNNGQNYIFQGCMTIGGRDISTR